jgi:hypothetical protein
LKRAACIVFVAVFTSLSFLSCGYSASTYQPPSKLTTRVAASQSVSSSASFPGLVLINGENDTPARASEIGAGSSPGLMAISPDRTTLLAFDSATNNVNVINAKTEASTGAIALPGPTTSMVVLNTGFAYATVPSALFTGSAPGAVEVMNLSSGNIPARISVPNAQTVVASPDGTILLVFASDSNDVTFLSPLLVNTGSTVSTTVSGFDRPVYAVFSTDGSTAYILNCGAECGGAQASVQPLNLASMVPGTPVPVDGATIGWLNGSTLYVAGNSLTNNACTGQTTAAITCGRLDLVDLNSLTVTSSLVITDGYHDRIDMSVNSQLFIGSHTCTNVGNVSDPQGEVRGCLSILDTTTGIVVIPPDNGDVTGFQSFTSRFVEYVAESGHLRVYDTTKDILLIDSFISNGTVSTPGQITDAKAIDFF